MTMDDDDDIWSPFLGFGSVGDLRDADEPEPRLAGLKSVSPAAARALQRKRPQPTRHPCGFHRPRARL